MLRKRERMLLNDFLPEYEFHEVHTVRVNAKAEQVFRAMKELTASELSPLIFLLMKIRSLPAKLSRRETPRPSPAGPFLEQMVQGGFIHLAEVPGREIVFGLIGQFWKPDGGKALSIHEPNAFLAFDDARYAKVAANLFVQDIDGEVRCSTETRIHALAPATRRKFAFYWGIISMGSGIIRVLWLRAIKRKAEKLGVQEIMGLPLTGGRSRR